MNSLPKTPKINEWLHEATHQLSAAGIISARLDAEIILAHTLRKNRTYLHAHQRDTLEARQYEIAEARLRLRLDRTPIAYIIGHKEFYGRLFKVTPATLIPRPESETIIDLLKETYVPTRQSLLQTTPKRLIDIGSGSGCLGITAKLELPEFEVTLADISHHALKVAQSNAAQLGADVTILQSNLLESYPFTPDCIVANLPYVDRSWERSPETKHEPEGALFAEDGGLHLINKLTLDTAIRLAPAGRLFLEADPRQHTDILKLAGQHGLKKREVRGYCIHLQKT